MLLQELSSCARLLAVVRSQCEGLSKVVDSAGELPSPTQEANLQRLVAGEVPVAWAALGPRSLKPLRSWVRTVQDQLGFLLAWATREGLVGAQEGEGRRRGSASVPPGAFHHWLPGLTHPDRFLLAVAQVRRVVQCGCRHPPTTFPLASTPLSTA